MSITPIPEVGEVWRHHRGTRYVVILVANKQAVLKMDEYPLTVVYRDPGGAVWSKPLTGFMEKFERAPMAAAA